jgi:hypothetical protein
MFCDIHILNVEQAGSGKIMVSVGIVLSIVWPWKELKQDLSYLSG